MPYHFILTGQSSQWSYLWLNLYIYNSRFDILSLNKSQKIINLSNLSHKALNLNLDLWCCSVVNVKHSVAMNSVNTPARNPWHGVTPTSYPPCPTLTRLTLSPPPVTSTFAPTRPTYPAPCIAPPLSVAQWICTARNGSVNNERLIEYSNDNPSVDGF